MSAIERHLRRAVFTLAFGMVGECVAGGDASGRAFNDWYEGAGLNRVAFPIGGIGAGMFCLEGAGAISHVSVRHQMQAFNEPLAFAAISIMGDEGSSALARVVEGPIPDWKYFGRPGSANGGGGTTYGLPRFRDAKFLARFPFGRILLTDPEIPVEVEIVGWSPFTPPDPDPSSLPLGAIEYRFRNRADRARRAVFSFHASNFMGNGPIEGIQGGFVLRESKGGPAFAFFMRDSDPVVDHCWFRGGWRDALTIAWTNVERGTPVANPPAEGPGPGASLWVPFELGAGEEKTLRLLACWHVPTSTLRFGRETGVPAFRGGPSHGTAKNGQQPVSGFLGRGLANSFDPGGDGPIGKMISPEFTIEKRYLHFLIGGGNSAGETCIELLMDDRPVRAAVGKRSERLAWETFDLGEFAGRRAKIRLVDGNSAAWGHILADHFILSNETIESLRVGEGNEITGDRGRVTVLQDFEGRDYGGWKVVGTAEAAPATTCGCEGAERPESYVPWYATKFPDISGIAAHWRQNFEGYKKRSELFRDAFYGMTLPPEVVEAAAANLTILKTPTVLRQHDGRLWCWEGCSDNSGCCAGSCTHVWNYAQALCHLFPILERGMRDTEFCESLDAKGRQAFRTNLPLAPGGGAFDAADGQLGGIMKAYRDWRISGDDGWLKATWPRIKRSLDYAIEKWDPRRTGLLEEEHHNTYDINYFGPDGHCGSFYLGALAAAIRMGEAAGGEVGAYRDLLAKGRRRMEKELYNGEYFIQIVARDGLSENFKPLRPEEQSVAYRGVVEELNRQGPKYQYGTGCLSDGVLGLWMAAACGIDDALVDPSMVKSHLLAVHRHNLKKTLLAHANPQRPTYAMGDDGGLLLCSWPRGGKPLLPFVYSDEVWTGIEYQVASHLMMLGNVAEGLEIVRACRQRYDGRRRNPFNEYECGHWYARAMSSYGLLQGLTGVRYDALTKTLFVDSRVGDFRTFLATATGFGTVTLKGDSATLDVVSGSIGVAKTTVAKPAR